VLTISQNGPLGTGRDLYVMTAWIDQALELHGPKGPGVEWLAADRVSHIGHQHWSIEERMAKHSHSMRTAVIRRRDWAGDWRWRGKWG